MVLEVLLPNVMTSVRPELPKRLCSQAIPDGESVVDVDREFVEQHVAVRT